MISFYWFVMLSNVFDLNIKIECINTSLTDNEVNEIPIVHRQSIRYGPKIEN